MIPKPVCKGCAKTDLGNAQINVCLVSFSTALFLDRVTLNRVFPNQEYNLGDWATHSPFWGVIFRKVLCLKSICFSVQFVINQSKIL